MYIDDTMYPIDNDTCTVLSRSVHTHTDTHRQTHRYTHLHLHTHTHTHTDTLTGILTYTYTYTHTDTLTGILTYTYTYTHTDTLTAILTYTHTHTDVASCTMVSRCCNKHLFCLYRIDNSANMTSWGDYAHIRHSWHTIYIFIRYCIHNANLHIVFSNVI